MALFNSKSSRFLRAIQQKFSSIKSVTPKSDDPEFREVMLMVNNVLSTRNLELRMYRDFYSGGDNQKIYFPRFESETDSEYEDRMQHSVVLNRTRKIISKGQQCLYSVTPPERRMEEEKAHQRMMEVWRFNNVLSGYFHTELCSLCLLYGFAVVENRYSNKSNRKKEAGIVGKNEDNEIIYVLQDTPSVIPIPRADDPREMGSLIRIFTEDKWNSLLRDKFPEITYVELIDDARWIKWAVEVNKDTSEVRGVRVPYTENGPNFIDQNPYGNVNIPFSLYRNPGELPFVLDGQSDLCDIISPQIKFNETISDTSHVIESNTYPILFSSGFEIPRDFKRGASGFLSHRNYNSDLKYVTFEGDLEANDRLSRMLERQIRELSGWSPISEGDLTAIGQVRNLRGAMIPDLLTISMKQVFFEKHERDHAKATLSVIEFHEETKYKNKELDIVFTEDFIPVDTLTQAEAETLEIKSGISNIRDIIKKRHPELTDEAEIDAKVEETRKLLEDFGLIQKPQVNGEQNRVSKESM